MHKPTVRPVLCVVLLLSLPLPARAADHPLDPLSYQEMWRVLELLREAGHMDRDTRFSELTLQEPAKRDVLAWRPGAELPRAAYALVRRGHDTYEATVDLAAGRVASWERLTGAQPSWVGEEFRALVDKVLEHPDFIAGLAARGITDFTFLDCSTTPRGYFGTAEERGRRIGNVSCAESRGVRNSWTRRVEGLSAVVDLVAEEVLRVVDDGPVPLTDTVADFDRTTLDAPREVPGPLDTRQPLALGPHVRIHAEDQPGKPDPDQEHRPGFSRHERLPRFQSSSCRASETMSTALR